MLQVGIETRRTLHQLDILPSISAYVKEFLRMYIFLFTYTLNGSWSAQFMKRALHLRMSSNR